MNKHVMYCMSTALKQSRRELFVVFKRFISSSVSSFSSGAESDKDSRDHMKRTENIPREKPLCLATVIESKDLSPNIKGLTLFIEENNRHLAKFKAGQWIDMFIPQVDTVGGFSICNSPKELLENGKLELAVKFSDHPPAFWAHSKCRIGDRLKVRVGGKFYTTGESPNDLLLVAGGLGINPLLSIFRHHRDLILDDKDMVKDRKITLLYSAKTYDGLIFKDEIGEICQEIGATCYYHITKDSNEGTWPALTSGLSYSNEKISQASLKNAIRTADSDKLADCYICGPPAFIERIEDYLVNLGVSESRIFYEKWW